MTSRPAMADQVSADMAAQAIGAPGKTTGHLPTTPTPTPNSGPRATRIRIVDPPGEPTTLTLAVGDLELSIGLGPAERGAVAADLIEGARRRIGRADWPSTTSIFEDRDGGD